MVGVIGVSFGCGSATRPGSNYSRLDINFRRKGSMDRALVCNLKKFGTLFIRQWPYKMNVAFDSIKHSFFGFAFGAIGGVDFRVPQMNRNFLERPSFATSIHPHGHRGTCSQGGKQKIVGG